MNNGSRKRIVGYWLDVFTRQIYFDVLALKGKKIVIVGSLICKGDPALNRIVKYIPQLPSSDFKGETLYIRFKEGHKYKVFSPFFVPTLDAYDLFECHVGLSYQKIISEFYQLFGSRNFILNPF